MVSNRAREVRYALAQPSVCPDLVRLAVKLQVRPQGRPDETRALDPDHAGVEEVDPDFGAFVGEPRPRIVDLRAIELVVPEDVDDVRGGSPELRELRHESPRVGRKVAGEDDDVGRGVVLGHRSTMLEVEIGKDLNLHRWSQPWGSFAHTQRPCSPRPHQPTRGVRTMDGPSPVPWSNAVCGLRLRTGH